MRPATQTKSATPRRAHARGAPSGRSSSGSLPRGSVSSSCASLRRKAPVFILQARSTQRPAGGCVRGGRFAPTPRPQPPASLRSLRCPAAAAVASDGGSLATGLKESRVRDATTTDSPLQNDHVSTRGQEDGVPPQGGWGLGVGREYTTCFLATGTSSQPPQKTASASGQINLTATASFEAFSEAATPQPECEGGGGRRVRKKASGGFFSRTAAINACFPHIHRIPPPTRGRHAHHQHARRSCGRKHPCSRRRWPHGILRLKLTAHHRR